MGGFFVTLSVGRWLLCGVEANRARSTLDDGVYEGAERIYCGGKKTLRYKRLNRLQRKCPPKQSVPQGLKPHLQQNIFGTAEAVPLSKTGFFRSL